MLDFIFLFVIIGIPVVLIICLVDRIQVWEDWFFSKLQKIIKTHISIT